MGYCIHCGYDLQAHRAGVHCPECGRVAKHVAPRPLPGAMFSWVALGIVLVLPMVWVLAGDIGSFYILCASAVIALVLLWRSVQQYRGVRLSRHMCSMAFSAAAAVVPLATLILFLIVFVIGRSSSVAQMAGDSGFDYWSLWHDVWPLLLLGNPVCMLLALAAFAVPPYGRRYVASWALPAAVLLAAVAAGHLVVVCAPDA